MAKWRIINGPQVTRDGSDGQLWSAELENIESKARQLVQVELSPAAIAKGDGETEVRLRVEQLLDDDEPPSHFSVDGR